MTSPRRRPRPPAGNGDRGPVSLTVADLLPFAPGIDEAQALAMIEDGIALAAAVAPCILHEDFTHAAAAKAIIRAAILRWHDQGSGSLQQLTADVFGMRIDNRQPRQAGGFYRTELDSLRRLCQAGRGAFTIDIAPGAALPADWWEGETTWQEIP